LVGAAGATAITGAASVVVLDILSLGPVEMTGGRGSGTEAAMIG
jgi:hypothetical protein